MLIPLAVFPLHLFRGTLLFLPQNEWILLCNARAAGGTRRRHGNGPLKAQASLASRWRVYSTTPRVSHVGRTAPHLSKPPTRALVSAPPGRPKPRASGGERSWLKKHHLHTIPAPPEGTQRVEKQHPFML